MFERLGSKLMSPIRNVILRNEREILKEELKKEMITDLLKVEDQSDEIGWRLYDYLGETGIMLDGNVLLNDEVDEMTYMVKDYIIEKMEGSNREDDTKN